MKKFLTITALLSLSNLIINAESLKINNKFNGQVYITVTTSDNNKPINALINGNSSKSINYDGNIEDLIIDFQNPGIAPQTISQDAIPANFKSLTIFSNQKISLQ